MCARPTGVVAQPLENGEDTHLDTIHLAAITDTGQLLADAEFRTTPTGYWAASVWARSFGDVPTVGV
ncbi:hypothetical protein [Mycolicibacterium sp. CH28]|uniref:hypothetical protein n=1 Tax=Mycolicibacterium sp. CH28 TaxID=2512237 RepID=UPI001913D326|nr:hypothetical protein [Mycolicibacterium sp. CH28]